MDNHLEFAEGSYGFNKVISLFEPDGTPATLTGYTAGTLTVKDNAGTQRMSVSLTVAGSTVVWAINQGDTDFNGKFKGQIKITGAGKVDRTYLFDVEVIAKLD